MPGRRKKVGTPKRAEAVVVVHADEHSAAPAADASNPPTATLETKKLHPFSNVNLVVIPNETATGGANSARRRVLADVSNSTNSTANKTGGEKTAKAKTTSNSSTSSASSTSSTSSAPSSEAPAQPSALGLLAKADAFIKAKKYKEAVDVYADLSQGAHSVEVFSMASYWVQRAFAHEMLCEHKKAADLYQIAKELRPLPYSALILGLRQFLGRLGNLAQQQQQQQQSRSQAARQAAAASRASRSSSRNSKMPFQSPQIARVRPIGTSASGTPVATNLRSFLTRFAADLSAQPSGPTSSAPLPSPPPSARPAVATGRAATPLANKLRNSLLSSPSSSSSSCSSVASPSATLTLTPKAADKAVSKTPLSTRLRSRLLCSPDSPSAQAAAAGAVGRAGRALGITPLSSALHSRLLAVDEEVEGASSTNADDSSHEIVAMELDVSGVSTGEGAEGDNDAASPSAAGWMQREQQVAAAFAKVRALQLTQSALKAQRAEEQRSELRRQLKAAAEEQGGTDSVVHNLCMEMELEQVEEEEQQEEEKQVEAAMPAAAQPRVVTPPPSSAARPRVTPVATRLGTPVRVARTSRAEPGSASKRQAPSAAASDAGVESTVVVLAPVLNNRLATHRPSPNPRDFLLSPVRRSGRFRQTTGPQTMTEVNSLLEKTNYQYSPNPSVACLPQSSPLPKNKSKKKAWMEPTAEEPEREAAAVQQAAEESKNCLSPVAEDLAASAASETAVSSSSSLSSCSSTSSVLSILAASQTKAPSLAKAPPMRRGRAGGVGFGSKTPRFFSLGKSGRAPKRGMRRKDTPRPLGLLKRSRDTLSSKSSSSSNSGGGRKTPALLASRSQLSSAASVAADPATPPATTPKASSSAAKRRKVAAATAGAQSGGASHQVGSLRRSSRKAAAAANLSLTGGKQAGSAAAFSPTAAAGTPSRRSLRLAK